MSIRTVQRLLTGMVLGIRPWLLTGCGHAPSHDASPGRSGSGQEKVIPVTTAPVTARAMQRRVEVVGTLEGYEEVNISPKVQGRIVRIYHDIGDEVTPGEPLVDLEDIDYRLAVKEAQRGLDLELARLGLGEIPGNGKFDLSKVPGVIRAQNVEENARMVLDRARRLGVGKVIATEELERAQTESRIAQAGRQQAEMEAMTTLAAARLRQAQLEIARQKQADTRITVPSLSPERMPRGVSRPEAIRYVVAARKVAEGEMVQAGQAPILFRLVITQPLKLVATVPEAFIAEIKNNQAVALRVEAYPGETFPGVVSRINPTVDRVNRTFAIEVAVPNESRKLRPGSFTKASILTRQADRALTVPEESIVRFAGVVKVFEVVEDRARAVEIRTGEAIEVVNQGTRSRWVEVDGQLSDGGRVVTSGQTQLANDTPVRIRTPGNDE